MERNKLESETRPDADLRIEVWSDVACPWCWVGKRHLEAAIEDFEGSVDVVWRAFELDPNAPPSPESAVDYVARLAKKYGTARDEAQSMIDRITGVGAEDGLDFRFDRIKPGNTFDAHRLLLLAEERGVQNTLKERLFLGYLHEGQSISRSEILTKLAVDAGLDHAEVCAVLESDRYADAVREEEAEAHKLGVSGVPFFVIDRRYAVSGAQPAGILLEAMTRAHEDLAPENRAEDGDTCRPDGCATN